MSTERKRKQEIAEEEPEVERGIGDRAEGSRRFVGEDEMEELHWQWGIWRVLLRYTCLRLLWTMAQCWWNGDPRSSQDVAWKAARGVGVGKEFKLQERAGMYSFRSDTSLLLFAPPGYIAGAHRTRKEGTRIWIMVIRSRTRARRRGRERQERKRRKGKWNNFKESALCPSAVVHRAAWRKMFGIWRARGIWHTWGGQQPFWRNLYE